MVGSPRSRSGENQPRCWLRCGPSDIPLREGWVMVGRNPSCDLVLDDELVSRNHLRLAVTEDGVLFEDLSTNGVFIEGERVDKRRLLTRDTRLVLGRSEIEIIFASDRSPLPTVPPPPESVQTTRPPPPSRAPSSRDAPAPSGARVRAPQITGQADAMTLLGAAVDRMLAEGRNEAAERVVAPRLHGLLEQAKASGTIKAEQVVSAAQMAVKLGRGLTSATWIEYAFELCTINPDPMPLDLVEELYSLVRRLPPIRISVIRDYIAALNDAAGRLTPSERFVLQRLQGLEKLAASR